MENYDWVEKLAKEGRRRTFSEYDARFWRAVQRKYSEDYAKYLAQLLNLYAFDLQNPDRVRIKKDIALVKSIVKEVDNILSTGGNKKEKLESSKMVFQAISVMGSELKQLQADGGASAELAQKIKRAEVLSGVQVKELQRSSGIMQGRAAKMKYSAVPLLENIPGTKRLGMDVVKGAISGVLGPLGGFAKVAWGDIYGMLERRRERKKEATIGALLTSGEQTLEGSERMREYLEGGGIEGRRGRFREEYASPALPGYDFGGAGMGKTLVGRDPFLQALNVFFSRDAFRCRWTNEIYEAVTHKKGEDELRRASRGALSLAGLLGMPTSIAAAVGDSISAIKKILPMIEKALPILGSAIALAAAAYAGWKAGRWLDENVKIAGKPLREWLPAVALIDAVHEGMIGLEKSKRQREVRESHTPRGKRALELVDQGLSVKAAIAQADAESKVGAPIRAPAVSKEVSALEMGDANIISEKGHLYLEQRVPIKNELPEGPAPEKLGEPTAGKLTDDGVIPRKIVTPKTEYEKTKGIPIDTSLKKATESNEEGFDKLALKLDETNEEIKKSGKRTNVGQSSGAEAYNTRDPMLASANAGLLTVYA